MREIEQFSALVADIYGASLDPSLWTPVLEKICTFVPGAIGSLILQDAATKRAMAGFSHSLTPAWNELYLTRYLKTNPIFPALLLCEAGEIFRSCDLIPAARMAQTLFYREYLQPQGLGEAVGAVLVKSATSFAAFIVVLPGGLGQVEEKSLQRVRLLIPHVQRAVLIGKVIDPAKAADEVHKATLSPSTFPELIAKQFGLTPTELGVMFSIIEVGDVPEAASVLGLSPAIIKTHLRSILAKTGTKEHADLARLVVQLLNPVAE
jgi:DNA-binding CsgD family transcriptional regulator